MKGSVLPGAALLVLCQGVLAAEVQQASAWQEEMLVSGRRQDQSLNTVIGGISRIDQSVLQQVGHVHPQEVAVRIPGVWFSRGNGQEMLMAIRSPVNTGPGSCGEILLAENGVPVRPAGLCNVNGMFEVNTGQAGALEVSRGPGTVFYGSNAVLGVVNVLSPSLTEQRLSLEAGSFDYYRLKVAAGVAQGDHQWQLTGQGTNSSDVKDNAGLDQQKLNLQHRYSSERWSAHTLLSATNLNQETAGYITGEDAYEDYGWKDNTNPEAYRDASALRLSTRFAGSAGDRNWSLTPYLRYSDMVFLQHYLPGQPVEENGQRSAGLQAATDFALTERSRLWLGAEVEWADMWVQERQDAVFINAINPRYQGDHYDFDVASEQLGVFANTETRLTDVWTVEAGLRYEYLRYDYDNRLPDGAVRDDGSLCGSNPCRYLRVADRVDEFDNLSGQLGLRANWNAQWMSYVRLAHAYRAPQINERYRLLAGQSVNEFDEKEIDSLEAGLRYQAEGLSVQLSAYRMKKQDEVLKASNNVTIGDAETRHTGVELELAQQLGDAWYWQAAAAWAEHEVVDASLLAGTDVDGNRLDTAPEWQGSARLGYRQDGWQAELEAVYLGSYYLDAENRHRYPGHTLWNAFVQWSLAEPLQARLRLVNLADERYAERGDYAFGSYRYFTGQPRSAYIELTYSW
ncbi:TonB-dependent receptor [Pseudomaricurvus sp. HS19]|uniref:TonB-dependent receptor n=1 Tax=Pseudomaricurvus sp. HS19 TaxID=2692626 RepID=UPI0013694A1C|nr:TonB-dependent receptor [Pseudomaricurvus sp. HS19]MYM65011.1 TonB-dependent receptor [Pseudomaricurvus sp. HS19]